MNNYICRIASIDDISKKYDYEIEHSTKDIDNWIAWKKSALERTINKQNITYIGLLNNNIICECTAAIDSSIVQNNEGLIDENTAYLYAFRTIDDYQGQGYFSKLFNYMIDDLKKRGYKKVTLGVEPEEKKNKEIYFKYGFIEHIKDGKESYPDGTLIDVEYYGKSL